MVKANCIVCLLIVMQWALLILFLFLFHSKYYIISRHKKKLYLLLTVCSCFLWKYLVLRVFEPIEIGVLLKHLYFQSQFIILCLFHLIIFLYNVPEKSQIISLVEIIFAWIICISLILWENILIPTEWEMFKSGISCLWFSMPVLCQLS